LQTGNLRPVDRACGTGRQQERGNDTDRRKRGHGADEREPTPFRRDERLLDLPRRRAETITPAP
jgi:hypothetical protein